MTFELKEYPKVEQIEIKTVTYKKSEKSQCDKMDKADYRKRCEEIFKIDSYGIQIGLHYLYGDGKSIVDIDGRWGNYLMENNTLTEKVGNIVIPIGESLEEGETINVSMTMIKVALCKGKCPSKEWIKSYA